MRLIKIYKQVCYNLGKTPVLITDWEILMEILNHNSPHTSLGKDRDFILYMMFDYLSDHRKELKFELNQVVSALIQSISRPHLEKLMKENDCFDTYNDAKIANEIFNTLDYLTILATPEPETTIDSILHTYQNIYINIKNKYFVQQCKTIFETDNLNEIKNELNETILLQN
jgi:hypothetical protein